MKILKCKKCNEEWFIEDSDLDLLTFCPFCESKVKESVDFEEIDSLDKLIYTVVSKMGIDTLNDFTRFAAIMSDLAPRLNKEIRIFTKNIAINYVEFVRQILNESLDESQSTVKKLRFLLIENEGLSESWADLICDGLYGAAKYINGQSPKKIINLTIMDYPEIIHNKKLDSSNLKTDEVLTKKALSIPAVPVVSNMKPSTSHTLPNNLKASDFKVGSKIEFGIYPNDRLGNKKPILWRVLDVMDDRALMITEFGIEAKRYNEKNRNVTWETCTLRNWLNTTFIDEAFSNEEQKAILTVKVIAEKNERFKVNPGNDTEDKVFLLSIQEVKKYFSSYLDRITGITAWPIYNYYAPSLDLSKENPEWSLRTSGRGNRQVAVVDTNGYIDNYGKNVHIGHVIRPALWISIGNK